MCDWIKAFNSIHYQKMNIFFKIRRRISRQLNQLHRYDFPMENNEWRKYGATPVIGNKDTGTLFDPYCFVDGDVLCMIVSDRNNGCVSLFVSINGIDWKKERVLLSGINGTWEQVVNRGCLIERTERHYLWYTGQYNGKSSIGLAISQNGKDDFQREHESPVLTATEGYEGLSVMNPCVLWDEDASIFKMWYSAGENYEPDVICYAESEDGIHWNKFDKPVLEKYSEHRWEQAKVGGCQVLKEKDGSYTIYYIGYQNVDVARICIAHSKDGIHWKRDKNNLLLGPTKGSWDADATYKPTVVRMGGKTYMWYNGRTKNSEYIGLAIK